MRVLIADDHQIVRKGVCAILAGRRDIEVCGEAEDGQEAVDKVLELKPDLVILDITMPKLNGFMAAGEIRKNLPNIPILLVSTHDSKQFANIAKSVGIRGYVVKTQAGAVLLNAVDAILQGEEFFPNFEQSGDAQAIRDRTSVSSRTKSPP